MNRSRSRDDEPYGGCDKQTDTNVALNDDGYRKAQQDYRDQEENHHKHRVYCPC